MSHLQNSLAVVDRYSAEAEPFVTLANEVADLPDDQLERALVLAASLPKSVSDVKPPVLKKARAPFLQALAKRFAGSDAFLQAVNLAKVFADPPMAGPWSAYEKTLKAVVGIDGIDPGRFCLAAMELWFSGETADALLRGALQTAASSPEVFVAYRAGFARRELAVHVELHLAGEMFAGVGALRDLQWMKLFGTHTGTAHLAELTSLAPFGLHYRVKAPKLANLLPIRNQLRSLTVGNRCADLAPVLQFERLEKLVVATEDLPKAFEVLGKRPDLIIADPINTSDPEGTERLRATFQS